MQRGRLDRADQSGTQPAVVWFKYYALVFPRLIRRYAFEPLRPTGITLHMKLEHYGRLSRKEHAYMIQNVDEDAKGVL